MKTTTAPHVPVTAGWLQTGLQRQQCIQTTRPDLLGCAIDFTFVGYTAAISGATT